jgi:metal-responsive CopG/Arc/MetJ family transcriptional regulator
MVRVTTNLRKETIQAVMQLTGAKNKSQAINQALETYVQDKRMKKLLALKGKLNLEDNWRALRELELNER